MSAAASKMSAQSMQIAKVKEHIGAHRRPVSTSPSPSTTRHGRSCMMTLWSITWSW